MYNLFTQSESPVTTNGANQYGPDIWGDKVVWQDHRNGNADIYLATLGMDNFPPVAVKDLRMDSRTSASITLSWTAPGDDGTSGTATEYDLRYSAYPITETNWSTATSVAGEPTPQMAGSAESFEVTGLNPGTSYHFAIKARDEVSNWSSISNRLNAYTLIEGDITADGLVDIDDLYIVARAFGSQSTDPSPPWNPRADLYPDGYIDIDDLYIVARNFGRSVPPPQSY